MRLLKVRRFCAEIKKLSVTDAQLIKSAEEFVAMDKQMQKRAALGAGLYKIRLATKTDKGKSGGSRAILAFREGEKLIWLHVFDKKDKENITTQELKKLKQLSSVLLTLSEKQLTELIFSGELKEVTHNG